MNEEKRRNDGKKGKRGVFSILDLILTHAAIVISGMLIVFFAIDRVNSHMGFMTNEFHKCLTVALSVLAIYLAGYRIAARRRRKGGED